MSFWGSGTQCWCPQGRSLLTLAVYAANLFSVQFRTLKSWFLSKTTFRNGGPRCARRCAGAVISGAQNKTNLDSNQMHSDARVRERRGPLHRETTISTVLRHIPRALAAGTPFALSRAVRFNFPLGARPGGLVCNVYGSSGTIGGGAHLGLHCEPSIRGHGSSYEDPGIPHLAPRAVPTLVQPQVHSPRCG